VRRTYRPHPTDIRLAGKRPARPLRSFAPPGSPFSDDLRLGQAKAARRCSPGVLPPSELAPPRFRVRSLAKTYAGGKAPCHVHLRAPRSVACATSRLHSATWTPTLGSRAQDPSIRRVYRTPRTTVRRRPSSPSASRALPCASRQLRPAPCRALKIRSVLPVPPLRRHPAPPCPSRRVPP